MHPFLIGQEYERARLLDFVGSRQMQSGVIWGRSELGCLICTSGGRGGKSAGYSDHMLADGTWWYFGQGRVGDQSLANSANAKLSSGNQSVLLFTTREPTAREVKVRGGYGKLFAFRGEFNVVGHEAFVPQDGGRQGDRLLRFRLVPVGGQLDCWSEEIIGDDSVNLQEMQRLLGVAPDGETGISLRMYRQRSARVHSYAMRRSGGRCEGCGQPAPFHRFDGRAFLEVHHMTRLADDGPDLPINVIALCPNCHRRAHYSADRVEFGSSLREFVALMELRIASGQLSGIDEHLS
ncbi:HNH endonuclease [Pseudomonas asplenii]|uniref:HNH endonuclease n=1 Tax=Pseudomonas asplenii TaxID=53407 RepID=UPI0009B7B42B